MSVRKIIFNITTLLLLSTSIYAADTKPIYIDVVGEGKFEVIYHRALSNATGINIAGLIGPGAGLIGAGIQSGVESGRDREKTDQLRLLINKDAWKVRFLETLNDKLETEGFEAVWVEDAKKTGDGLVLKIYLENYGFKLVDSSTHAVSAFIDFKASLSNGSSKDMEEWEKEAFYLTNRNQYSFEQLLGENSPVNSDLEAVLEKAALRLANKIIYTLKD
jgi:hypothetical protein